MSPAEAISTVADEIREAGRRLADTTRETDRWRGGYFRRWCERRGLVALPARQETLVQLIEEHWDVWSWAHMRGMATTVSRMHLAAGEPDPAGRIVKRLVRRAGRDKGRVAQPLVDAMTLQDLAQICSARRGLPGGPSPRGAFLAAALVIGALLGAEFAPTADSAGAALAGIDLECVGEMVRVVAPGRRLLVDPARDPFAFEVLRRVAQFGWLDDARVVTVPPPARGVALDLAWARAGMGPVPPLLQPATMPDDELRWLVANLDPELARRRRDVAYLTVGVLLALRHQDLAHLELPNVAATPEGYHLLILQSKTDQDSARPARALPHVGGRPGTCRDELCPACALDDYLRVVQAQGRVTGPVFATRYGGRWKPMTRQNGRLLIKNAWQEAELDTAGSRIATRTMRCTGATLAYESGMPLEKIAATVTLHRGLDQTRLYVRALVPDGFELDL